MDDYEQFYYGHSNAEQFITEHLKDQSNNVPLGLAANPYILKKVIIYTIQSKERVCDLDDNSNRYHEYAEKNHMAI